MLSFAEELYLLALDDITGKLTIPNRDIVLNSALLGAVFSELSFLGKIDTDVENLFILDSTPTSRPVLDFAIKSLVETGKTSMSTEDALGSLLADAEVIETLVREQLVDKGILKLEEDRILWIFPSRRYPVINNQEIQDVESRLRSVVTDPEAIPDPRETVLVSLVHACDLFREILSPREFRRSESRIRNLARMDLVGQKVLQLILHINSSLSTIAPFV